MWLLMIIAVHANNPQDVPGKIEIVFKDQISCEQSLQSMTYWLKFNQFKIEGKCVKK